MSAVQPPSRGRADAAMHIIRRADGEEMGEYAFWATDGPDGWDVAENADHDEDTVYEILACYPVSRRKFLWSTLCETCDGEGDGCPACGGSGECEPPDTEHLPGPAADVQVAPPRDEDAERKPLVYVAGPITGDPFGCVRQAMAAFQMIRHAGCVPFLPQLSVIGEMVEPQDYEAWMAYDLDVIDHCDALYRLRGDSAGADREVDHARSLGLPVLGLDGQDWPALCALTTRTPPPAPAVPVEQAGRRELDVTALPEWTAFIAAHDAATAITTPQPGVQPEGASAARTALIHAAHRLARAAAAPSPATEPDEPNYHCEVCTWPTDRCCCPPEPGNRSENEQWSVIHHNQIRALRFASFPIERLARASFTACDCGPHSLIKIATVTYTDRQVVIDAFTPPPPAAPAVSPEPERDEHASRADEIAAACWDSGGPEGEDAQMERQYERDHGIGS